MNMIVGILLFLGADNPDIIGEVIKIDGNKIQLSEIIIQSGVDDPPAPIYTVQLAEGAKIIINKEPGTLKNLKVGMTVEVWFDCNNKVSRLVGRSSPVNVSDKPRLCLQFTGKLIHPVVAIGGETTGTVIETKHGDRYDLDLGDKKEWKEKAEKLNGKIVVIIGNVKTIKGEVRERKVITDITEFRELLRQPKD